ncbi:MAG TPA: hypothetical protein VJT16_07495 [Streptosporangiaceae bacterium]|nr:hypothetical protein [Streptosporangiaceae bacterium]
METIIGFAIGYLAGTKDGEQGLERIKSSLRDIAQSKEARRLASDAVTMAGALVGRRSAQGAIRTAGGLVRVVVRQITEGPTDRNTVE